MVMVMVMGGQEPSGLRMITSGYRWFWVVTSGYVWLWVITVGYAWLRALLVNILSSFSQKFPRGESGYLEPAKTGLLWLLEPLEDPKGQIILKLPT